VTINAGPFGLDDTLPLRELSKRERMLRIRDATARLLEDREFSGITMRDVAREARVGEATLFRYVGSKEQLLVLVFGAKVDRQLDSLEADPRFQPLPGRTGREIVDAVRRLYRERTRLYLDDPVHVTEFVRAGLAPGNELGHHAVGSGDRIRLVVTRLIEHGQREGVLSEQWDASVISENCAGIYIHEIVRAPMRGFAADSVPARLDERLRVQLEPLIGRPDDVLDVGRSSPDAPA
jgi:AcrR family transcriptional regulator